MKLRMYLRGLGIGIVVTALIMIFAGNSEVSMTDSQIIAKAKALGMVEEDKVLKPVTHDDATDDATDEAAEKVAEKDVVKETEKEAATDELKSEKDDELEEIVINDESDKDNKTEEEKLASDNTENSEDSAADEKTDTATKSDDSKIEASEIEEEPLSEEKFVSSERMKLTISNGVSSYTVAKLLEQGGVVESASSFDEYLCQNHYDHSISAGDYDIPPGADYETIAKIITKRQ